MLGGQDFEKLILKPFKVGSEKLKDFLPGLTTQRNPFSFLNILHLEQGKEHPNDQWRVQKLHENLKRSYEGPTIRMKLRKVHIYKVEAFNLKIGK